MSNKVILKDEISEFNIGTVINKNENFPELIQGQISELNKLDTSIKKAIRSARAAEDSALNAKDKSAGFGKKRAAIEELQSAGLDLAEAVKSGVEAQKLSFEFQTKLAKISKYLFGLGVSNIASNRSVVRELEKKLNGASKEELSELARQELLIVVKQLKEQEDILNKQDELSKLLKGHNSVLKDHSTKHNHLDEYIIGQNKKNKYFENQITSNTDISTKLNNSFQKLIKVDEQHNALFAQQTTTNKQIEKEIQALSEISSKHDKQLKAQIKLNKEYVLNFDELNSINELQNGQLLIALENFENHNMKIQNITETNKRFEEKIDIQSLLIDELTKKNEELVSQLTSTIKTIEIQDKTFTTLKNDMDSLNSTLNTKATSKFSYLTFGMASIGTLLSIVHFLI